MFLLGAVLAVSLIGACSGQTTTLFTSVVSAGPSTPVTSVTHLYYTTAGATTVTSTTQFPTDTTISGHSTTTSITETSTSAAATSLTVYISTSTSTDTAYGTTVTSTSYGTTITSTIPSTTTVTETATVNQLITDTTETVTDTSTVLTTPTMTVTETETVTSIMSTMTEIVAITVTETETLTSTTTSTISSTVVFPTTSETTIISPTTTTEVETMTTTVTSTSALPDCLKMNATIKQDTSVLTKTNLNNKAACTTKCTDDNDKCVDITWRTGKTCYLSLLQYEKDQIDWYSGRFDCGRSARSALKRRLIDQGLKGNQARSAGAKDWDMSILSNTTSVDITDWEACRDDCYDTNDCMAFSFHTTDTICSLYEVVLG